MLCVLCVCAVCAGVLCLRERGVGRGMSLEVQTETFWRGDLLAKLRGVEAAGLGLLAETPNPTPDQRAYARGFRAALTAVALSIGLQPAEVARVLLREAR